MGQIPDTRFPGCGVSSAPREPRAGPPAGTRCPGAVGSRDCCSLPALPFTPGPGKLRASRGAGAEPRSSSPVRIFAITFGLGDDFRAEFSRSHWLARRHNDDHSLMLLAAAYCLLVVKDLLSIHQPPIFANYILLK